MLYIGLYMRKQTRREQKVLEIKHSHPFRRKWNNGILHPKWITIGIQGKVKNENIVDRECQIDLFLEYSLMKTIYN